MRARWLTDKYISLMLLVFPLWTGLEGYTSITRSKFLFFSLASAAYLLAAAACCLFGRVRPPRPGAAQWLAVAFMAAACLSAAASPYGSAVILGASRYDGLVTLLLYGGIFLAVSAFGEWKKYYVYLLAISSGLCSLVALLQLGGLNPLRLYPEGVNYYDSGLLYTGEFLGTIGNTNLLAAFYCLCIPLFAGHALTHRGRERWLLLPAALCAGVLIASRVASGLVALAAAAVILIPYYVNYIHRRRRLTLAVSAAMAALCALALAALYFYPGGSGTLWELSQVLHGRVDDSFGSSRVMIWRECLRLFSEAPLLGGGPDTLALRTELGFTRFVEETGVTLSTHVDNAHCEILNYLVNLGILGLAPYLGLCYVNLKRMFTARSGAAAALGGAFGCYLVQSLFGLGLCLVVPLVWIYIGLICSRQEEKICKTAPSPPIS